MSTTNQTGQRITGFLADVPKTILKKAAMKCGTNNIEDKVLHIIENKLGLNRDDYSKDSKFTEDLGCDSLDLLDIVMDCEFEFNILFENAKPIYEKFWALNKLEAYAYLTNKYPTAIDFEKIKP